MKKGIHPVQKVCKVKCACGNEFEVKSSKEEVVYLFGVLPVLKKIFKREIV